MAKKIIALLFISVLVISSAGFVFADTEYVVKNGDVLWKIAEKYNTTYQNLAEYNKIADPNLIYPNQTIRIPDGKTSPDTGSQTPAAPPAPAASEATAFEKFVGDIDVNYAAGVATKIASCGSNPDLGFRQAGSTCEYAAADYLYNEFKSIGLTNVRKEAVKVDTWEYKKGEIYYTDGKGTEQKILLGGYQTTLVADNEAVDVIYAGTGRTEDYQGLDPKGKLVIIEVDQYNDYWISKPAYEAHLRGAKAVLAVPVGGYGQHSDDTLSSQDICGPADAPVFAISVKDANALKDLISKSSAGSVKVRLSADSQVKRDGTSYNVVGEIPGKNPDEIIFLIGHYDGYYHAWHDNASGIALAASIAKSVITTGYQPDKTIVVIGHGAEEWGLTDSHYDWAIGSFKQIMVNHPEWQTKGFAVINLESGVARNDDDEYLIKSTHEIQNAVRESAIGYTGPAPANGKIEVKSPTSTWAEDFSYSLTGIPTMVYQRHNRNFSEKSYHTNYDVKADAWSQENYAYSHKIFGKILFDFDQMAVKPLDYTTRFKALKETIDPDFYPNVEAMNALLDQAIAAGGKLNQKIDSINTRYSAAVTAGDAAKIESIRAEAKVFNLKLAAMNKETFLDFTSLNWGDNIIFPTEAPIGNLAVLADAVKALESGDAETALDEYLWQIDDNWTAYGMSKETYQYFIDQVMNQPADRLAWGANMIKNGNLDLYDVIQSLTAKRDAGTKDFTDDIAVLKAGMEDQKAKLDKLAGKEYSDLQQFITSVNSIL
jgi:Iap family predicted aminopeptidase